MPISGQGWEILIERQSVQRNAAGRVRTVGRYTIFHNGTAASGALMTGTVAESPGPGSNAQAGNKKRVEAGTYPLLTQAGTKYVTIGYSQNANHTALPRPGVELGNTGHRSEILIHPGIGFLASIGCINLCTRLPDAEEPISFPGSRNRVIAMIDDMKAFLGSDFPTSNGKKIARAHAVIEGEP
ncbi:hypothetical protein [Sphingomonas sp.]|uniref:hypothetical protein n=1 Tax=Sphingomonas sp. TaxID=28214 RepID=UPI001B0EB784|nr:hypothetical protein [Sphingomonas sp.]MBO9713921.1 hypothetical protein [Sphingomonas sp.]